MYYIDLTKVKDHSGTEGRISRPPSVVIASSSKNKDNIVVGFENTSISGIYFYNLTQL